MTAHQFYEKKHGPNMHFLSKDAICTLMDEYVQHRKESYEAYKEKFNTEQWVNMEEIRKRIDNKKP